MKALARLVLVWVVILGHTSCTTMKTISDLPASEIQKLVKKGDRVQVQTASGETRAIVVTSIDQDTLSGIESGSSIQIPRDQITRLDVKRVSLIKTVQLGAVIYVAIAAFAMWYALTGLMN